MSGSIWGKLLGERQDSSVELEERPAQDFGEAIKKINMIEKSMLDVIDTISEPDYIGDFIEQGGLIGLEPMGYNAQSKSVSPEVSHTRLAQVAVNHSRLESALNRFKKVLKDTFTTLNESIVGGNVSLDARTQQALTDIVTHKERAKEEIRNLVLKPKTAEAMYTCFQKIDDDVKLLQKQFERCAQLNKE